MLVFPMIIANYEELCEAVRHKSKLLWLPYEFYMENKDQIDMLLPKKGYKYMPIPAVNGFFFARGLFKKLYRVSDPCRTY